MRELAGTEVTLLTRRDAAVLLSVPPSVVERLERKGELQARRTLGGGRYFLREDVERLGREATDVSAQGGDYDGDART